MTSVRSRLDLWKIIHSFRNEFFTCLFKIHNVQVIQNDVIKYKMICITSCRVLPAVVAMIDANTCCLEEVATTVAWTRGTWNQWRNQLEDSTSSNFYAFPHLKILNLQKTYLGINAVNCHPQHETSVNQLIMRCPCRAYPLGCRRKLLAQL